MREGGSWGWGWVGGGGGGGGGDQRRTPFVFVCLFYPQIVTSMPQKTLSMQILLFKRVYYCDVRAVLHYCNV